MALVVTLTIATVVALKPRQSADRARAVATEQRDVAAAGQLIAQSEALGDADPAIAKLESIAAWRIHPSNEARHAMLTAAALPGIAILTGHTSTVFSVAFGPDGKTLASGGGFDGTVRLWDVATHRQIGAALTGHTDIVYSVAFSPDGTTLGSGGADGTVRLWDVATHRQIGTTLTGPPTGRLGMFTRRHDPASAAKTTRCGCGRATGRSATHSPATPATSRRGVQPGRQDPASSGSQDDKVRLWDVATHRQIGDHCRIRCLRGVQPDGTTWPAAAAMERCGCGTWPRTGSGGPDVVPPDRDPPHRQQRPGLVGGVQPGRQDPGHRRRR
jgi:hypothetical protein